ncbi:MAG: polysaccharide biosynthesis protein [Oscillospiraceae bacterium]|nr:polysaccharide biosynthesis protein [Oscillospiraceae bacterium]
MSETSKKQNFLQGAALLAIATAIVKLIGAFYKLPLNMAIGAEGYSYFTTAYDIYSVMLLISTAGLPVAVSRMVSQASTLEHYTRMRKIFRTALTIFAIMGALTSVLMIFGAKPLANLMNQPDAWISIACLGPCGILICLMSAYRGYFNGQGNMTPTSVTQVIEAFIKLVVGLALAFLIIHLTKNVALAAGGAIIGVTMGSALALIYMLAKFRKSYKGLPVTSEDAGSTKETVRELLAIAIPITIGSAGLQLLTVIESGLYMDRLVHLIGSGQYMSHMVGGAVTAQKAAATLKGLFNMTQTIFNMPCAFIIPITVSVLPAVTSFLTMGDNKGVRETEESAARITGLLSLPCAVGLTVLARPIMALLGGYEGEQLDLSAKFMAIQGITVFLYAIIQYTNALLQSHGYVNVPVVNMLSSGVLRLALVYVMVGNPNLGLMGAPLGAFIGYLLIAVLNLMAMQRKVAQKPRLLRNLLRPALPALVMGVVVFFCYQALVSVLGIDGSRVILAGVPIAVGACVYFVCVVLMKSITREDCLLLPKGEKIAKLLRL